MTGIGDWLAKIDLGRYAAAFEAAEIDLVTLPLLTDDDLRQMGLPLGPRRRLLAQRDKPVEHAEFTADETEPVGERRHITVMFVDLVGSTELSTRVDPEILAALLSQFKAAVTDTVVGAGGTVAKYLGDGVLAYFGWPMANEDAAENAVRCAILLRDRVKGIAIAAGEMMSCRTGIATGLVVIGGATGKGDAREDVVAGEALNLAARLQGVAEPDGICVSRKVHNLVGQLFEFDFGGEHSLKGFSRSIEAWFPRRVARHSNRFAAKHSIKTPLVGRNEELALLVQRWADVDRGNGRVVLILGEAGIGKSRLLGALYERAAAEPHASIGLQCSSFHQTKPLYPVIEYVTRAADIQDDDGGPARLAKLAALLGTADVPIDDALPWFAALLAIPPEAGYVLPDLAPAQRRSATIAALGDWLRRIAEQQRLLLVLEDAHWADATTLEVLTRLINAVGGMRAMAVITGRPEFASPWSGRANVTVVGLDRLSDRQCTTLVRDIAAASHIDAATIDKIVARSDGNPLFAEELSATMLGPNSSGSQDVPDSLQSSLMARLDRLDEAKHTAQLCAVLGRRFARPLLALLSEAAPGMLDTNLSTLVAHDIIHPLGRASEGRYEFKHALVRDAAYDSLLLAERRRRHQRCARELERSFPDVVLNEPELLAFHFAQAALPAEAAAYFERAGDRAAASASYIEAIANYRAALLQSGALPPADPRDRRELGLLLKLGPALSIIDGAQSGGVRDVYERAEELGRSVNDLDGLFKAVWGLWYNANVGRDHERASAFADQLVVLSERTHDDVHVLEALHCRWSSAFFRGENDRSTADAERGVQLYDRERHHQLAVMFGGHDPGVCAGSCGGTAQILLGRLDDGMRTIRASIELADSLRHPHSMAHALMNGLTAAATVRDIPHVREWGARLRSIAESYNFPPQRAVAAFLLDWADAVDAKFDIDRLRLSFDAVVAIGPMTLLYVALFAEELLKHERESEALKLIDHFVETLKFPVGFYLPEIYRLRGECFARLGQSGEAARQFGEAEAVAVGQGAALFALRTLMSRSRLRDILSDVGPKATEIAAALTRLDGSQWPDMIAAQAMVSDGS